MLISCRLSIIGLHLLLLTHIAHTFVLLTANMEDVKKLARKFVSESLAEKIADFIATASKQVAPKVPEENERNEPENSHQFSEENNMYNVARQGEDSGVQEVGKSRDELQDIQDKLSEENQQETITDSFEQILKNEFGIEETETPKRATPKKMENNVRLEGPSRYAAVKPNGVKQYAYPLVETVNKKPISTISEEDEKYEKKEKNHKQFLDNNLITTPTVKFNYAENYIAANKPARKKVRGRPYRLLSHMDSIEDNEVRETVDANSTLTDFSENERFSQKRAMDLTTKKVVNEFDQYDCKKYPTPRLIATSGPVALPKIEEEKWWERELPSKADNKNKLGI